MSATFLHKGMTLEASFVKQTTSADLLALWEEMGCDGCQHALVDLSRTTEFLEASEIESVSAKLRRKPVSCEAVAFVCHAPWVYGCMRMLLAFSDAHAGFKIFPRQLDAEEWLAGRDSEGE